MTKMMTLSTPEFSEDLSSIPNQELKIIKIKFCSKIEVEKKDRKYIILKIKGPN